MELRSSMPALCALCIVGWGPLGHPFFVNGSQVACALACALTHAVADACATKQIRHVLLLACAAAGSWLFEYLVVGLHVWLV
jgi:hypothetical protein